MVIQALIISGLVLAFLVSLWWTQERGEASGVERLLLEDL